LQTRQRLITAIREDQQTNEQSRGHDGSAT
jgi:hypothetical protein